MDDLHGIAMVVCGVGALLARVGLALYHSGLVRAKNAAGTVLRHAADLCIAVLVFWAVAPAILNNAAAGPVFLGLHLKCFFGVSPISGNVFFLMSAMLIGSGILVGTLAERTRFFPSLAGSVLLAGVVIPVGMRWSSSGWLGAMHFLDLGGASFIHLSAAICAAAGAIAAGPRGGKYNRDGSSNAIPGHSVPLASAGVFVLFVGWFPYVLGFAVGPAASLIVMNLILAAAAGGLASLLLGHFRYGKPEIYLTYAGIVGGLVAISACAHVVHNAFAILIGAVAGLIIPTAILLIDVIWKVDDPGGGIAVHGVGGVWGLLAAGLFAPASSAAEKLRLVGVQLLGLAAIGLLAAALSAGLFLLLRSAVTLRPREADEFDGLDLAEHDIGAYPDFQQTTIKSYHLREA